MEHEAHSRAEIRRLIRHFDGALALLSRRDDARLPLGPRRRRARLREALRAYQARGRFPRNDRFAAFVPFFVDAGGTRCAMAHLIETSGHRRLVERVATSRNNALIRELEADAELRDWLSGHGMTAAEAARIQPSYGLGWSAGEFCKRAPYESVVRAVADGDGRARVVAVYGADKGLRVGQAIDLAIGRLAPEGREAFLVPYTTAEGRSSWVATSHEFTAEHVRARHMGPPVQVPIDDAPEMLLSPNCRTLVLKAQPRPGKETHGAESHCSRCSSAAEPAGAAEAIGVASMFVLCAFVRRATRR